jgi:predicted metal-dependent phosphoesterase TrpH
MATRQGLRAISITDHDTLEGARKAIQGEISANLSFLPGVEISTQAPRDCPVKGSLHILGYGISLDDAPLQSALEKLQQSRQDRIPKIVSQLNTLGLNIRLDRVMDEVGPGVAGRPHVANVLIKMGLVTSMDEAFDRYLGKGRPGYVEKARLDCRRAFDLIHGAGGIPVLAHPYLVQCEPHAGLGKVLESLCTMGLKGIEAYYPQHPPESTAFYLKMAQALDLLVTGGTDFHGHVTPDILMGSGYGQMHVPFTLYEKLLAALEQLNPKSR